MSLLREEARILQSIQRLGLYKLLFSSKVAFCFCILWITTFFMGFACWAVIKHVIDAGTFGVSFGCFGSIMGVIAGVYNITHSMNDRAAMQMVAQQNTPPPAPPVVPSPVTVNVTPTQTDPIATNPLPSDSNLPINGQP
jgi:hypothetical protein